MMQVDCGVMLLVHALLTTIIMTQSHACPPAEHLAMILRDLNVLCIELIE